MCWFASLASEGPADTLGQQQESSQSSRSREGEGEFVFRGRGAKIDRSFVLNCGRASGKIPQMRMRKVSERGHTPAGGLFHLISHLSPTCWRGPEETTLPREESQWHVWESISSQVISNDVFGTAEEEEKEEEEEESSVSSMLGGTHQVRNVLSYLVLGC